MSEYNKGYLKAVSDVKEALLNLQSLYNRVGAGEGVDYIGNALDEVHEIEKKAHT